MAAGPFPEKKPPLFFRKDYDRIVSRVRRLWQADRRAEALAELRRNERDLYGPVLAPLRREAERTLGLDDAGDEFFLPWKPLVFLSAGGLVFLAALTALYFRRGVTSAASRGYKNAAFVLILLTCAGAAGLVFSLADRRFGGASVLRAVRAYKVPDGEGSEGPVFPEGQRVRIRTETDGWAYAESSDGRAGWVRRENVIFY